MPHAQRMRRYAVIGAPIAHSLSPSLHQQFAKKTGIVLQYERILLDQALFEQQIKDFFAKGGRGLNITAPGKKRAFELAEIKTARCLKAGAANTLWMDSERRLCADNTDGVGLVQDLKRSMPLCSARVLLLGAGGAAQGIIPALLDEKVAGITIYNRTNARALACVEQIADKRVRCGQPKNFPYDLVINATGADFLQVNHLTGVPFCYDLTYSRSGLTPFVAWARTLGFSAMDGFGMLVAQAAEAFFVWHGIRP